MLARSSNVSKKNQDVNSFLNPSGYATRTTHTLHIIEPHTALGRTDLPGRLSNSDDALIERSRCVLRYFREDILVHS